MALSEAELLAQVKSTEAFILADPSPVQMSRTTKVPDGEGGWTNQSPDTLDPIIVRLIPQSDKVPEVSTSDGRLLRPEFVLMGMPLSDVQRDDTFLFHGITWQIAAVHEGPEYEFKADVVRLG